MTAAVRAVIHERIDVGPLSRALKFLHDEYKPQAYLWELVEVLRKLVN